MGLPNYMAHVCMLHPLGPMCIQHHAWQLTTAGKAFAAIYNQLACKGGTSTGLVLDEDYQACLCELRSSLQSV